jgi:hypothetical protein
MLEVFLVFDESELLLGELCSKGGLNLKQPSPRWDIHHIIL